MVEEEPLEPLEPELDGLEDAPLALDGLELDGLLELPLELLPDPELMPLEEEEPVEPLCPACHSERDSWPSWSVSSLSNSLELDEDDEVPPEADEGLDEELELPPEAADEGEDDLLLCDMDGEELEPLELFDSPAAYPAVAKASSEKLRAMGLMNFMEISPCKVGSIDALGTALRPHAAREAANMPGPVRNACCPRARSAPARRRCARRASP